MSGIGEGELRYLRSERRLARIATVGPNGMPHVTPVGFRAVPDGSAVEVRGLNMAESKKFRDVAATGRAAIVVDDLASVDPWRPRGVEVRGRAEAVTGHDPHIRIHAERVVSWGLGG